uniref:Putative ovule protein n=1 Tax=Solanum chacoense TaxID=4108 RepID=A0A0V0HF21_SOLCH
MTKPSHSQFLRSRTSRNSKARVHLPRFSFKFLQEHCSSRYVSILIVLGLFSLTPIMQFHS